MQIKRFSVKGYKNFVSEIVLDEFGVICVIQALGSFNGNASNSRATTELPLQTGLV